MSALLGPLNTCEGGAQGQMNCVLGHCHVPLPHASLQVPLGTSIAEHLLCAKHFAGQRGDGDKHCPKGDCSTVGQMRKPSSQRGLVTTVCSGY